MSESDEENFCFFGKPLEPYDEDAFPKKKPITLEEQVATDDQGRRRFHGAFTGGFSAGFFNTVGSLEGWLPAEFKSTRQEKAENVVQKPEDFMDDEDFGEFGIAPQKIKATKDYSTSKKRKKQVFSDGPIPGDPVLHSLLTSGNETIGYMLLRNMGIKDKMQQKQEIEEEQKRKVYGCEMPRNYEIDTNEDIKDQYEISEIYKEFLKTPKTNSFGLGYVGLHQGNSSLYQSAKLVISDKNKKKLSISGQAFGVGAFENDDEDIYVKDDMSKYDFELTSEKDKKKSIAGHRTFEDFIEAKGSLLSSYNFPPPTIPLSFSGKHKIRKSRFEPLPTETENQEEVKRKNINPEIRARYLGEEIPEHYTPSQRTDSNDKNKRVEKASNKINQEKSSNNSDKTDENKDKNVYNVSSTNLLLDRFVSASTTENPHDILEKVERFQPEHGTQDMREAARMKLFGPLTRVTLDWEPCAALCKRFNVPVPVFGRAQELKAKKRTRNLIFQFQEHEEINTFAAGLSKQKNEQTIEPEQLELIENIPLPPTSTLPEEVLQVKEEDKPKEVEIVKDLTEKLDIAEKIDLFKEVFLSSSESEDEEQKEETNKEREEIQQSILSDNLLQNVRSLKEGILSDIDFSKFQTVPKPAEAKPGYSQENEEEVEEMDFSYGPKLPTKLPQTIDLSAINNSDDNSEWIEKDKKSKKHKHKKKHKKKHKR